MQWLATKSIPVGFEDHQSSLYHQTKLLLKKNKVGYLFTIAGSLRSTQEQQRSITGSTNSFPLSLSLLVKISNIPYAAKFQLL